MHDTAAGILAQHYRFWLNELNNDPLPRGAMDALRRAFYAGAASVIDTIDEAESNEAAAHYIMIMTAEIQICADELNAANDHTRTS